MEFKGAPEGYVRIHPNHHLWSKTRVGRALRDVAEAHGLLLEEKSMGTALHYRHAPGREAIAA